LAEDPENLSVLCLTISNLYQKHFAEITDHRTCEGFSDLSRREEAGCCCNPKSCLHRLVILLSACPPFDLIVKTLYGCGLRLFECIGLRVQCLNFDAGVVTINKEMNTTIFVVEKNAKIVLGNSDYDYCIGSGRIVCEPHQLAHGMSTGEDLVCFAE
jgi:hypothetical protein